MNRYITLSAPNGFHGTKALFINPNQIASIEPFDTSVVTVKSYPNTTICMSDGSKKHVFEMQEEVLTLIGAETQGELKTVPTGSFLKGGSST